MTACKNIIAETEHKLIFIQYILEIHVFVIEKKDHPDDEKKLIT